MLKKSVAIILAVIFCLGLFLPVAFAEDGDTLPEETATPSPTQTVEPEETPSPSSEPEVTPEPEPTDEPDPTATPVPDVTPEPVATPVESPASTETQEPVIIEPIVIEPAIPTASEKPSGAGVLVKDQCVTMGADLTDAQRKAVYSDFGIKMGSVRELKVTNSEEREYLEGIVPDKKIGTVALSCCYITVLEKGSGLSVKLHNINYCAESMYINALTTAGVTDARVIVSAPYPVSGTGALTGIYKAYEVVTGDQLSRTAKKVGAEELVLTGDLSRDIGKEEATELISELKGILDQTKNMNDEEVRAEIRNIADANFVEITDAQVNRILRLCRKLEGLNETELQEELSNLSEKADTAKKVSKTVSGVFERVTGFFDSVGGFISDVFGGK
ncbi:MAG: DUF1002 domain-containing protein [Clostridia bacterium]|nr:DUF1002 domain-containing protein [Clostridia bacterium]